MRLTIRTDSNNMDKRVAYENFIGSLRQARQNNVVIINQIELDLGANINTLICDITPSPNYQITTHNNIGNFNYNYTGVNSDYTESYDPWQRIMATNTNQWPNERNNKLAVVCIIAEAARNQLIEMFMLRSLLENVPAPMRRILTMCRNYSNICQAVGINMGDTITINMIRNNTNTITQIVQEDVTELLAFFD